MRMGRKVFNLIGEGWLLGFVAGWASFFNGNPKLLAILELSSLKMNLQ